MHCQEISLIIKTEDDYDCMFSRPFGVFNLKLFGIKGLGCILLKLKNKKFIKIWQPKAGLKQCKYQVSQMERTTLIYVAYSEILSTAS